MRIVVDESVTVQVCGRLSGAGHRVTHVALWRKGASDEEVWRFVVGERAALVTRDRHFADPVAFDPVECLGIVFLRKGNLTIAEETDLVGRFFDRHTEEEFRGRFVTLSPGQVRIR